MLVFVTRIGGAFLLTGNSIVVTQPASLLGIDQRHKLFVAWSTSFTAATVRISVVNASLFEHAVLAEEAPNTGEFSWCDNWRLYCACLHVCLASASSSGHAPSVCSRVRTMFAWRLLVSKAMAQPGASSRVSR